MTGLKSTLSQPGPKDDDEPHTSKQGEEGPEPGDHRLSVQRLFEEDQAAEQDEEQEEGHASGIPVLGKALPPKPHTSNREKDQGG